VPSFVVCLAFLVFLFLNQFYRQFYSVGYALNPPGDINSLFYKHVHYNVLDANKPLCCDVTADVI